MKKLSLLTLRFHNSHIKLSRYQLLECMYFEQFLNSGTSDVSSFLFLIEPILISIPEIKVEVGLLKESHK